MKCTQNPFLQKGEKWTLSTSKCVISLSFFIISATNMMFNENFLKITLKKINHKPSGSTEMTHKYLACQFFFTIAVVHGSLK